jgi:ankyrin repeat protein
MSEPALPARPNLTWLRKSAKDELKSLRAHTPAAKLAHAQLQIARRYGFASWRKLKAHVESTQPAEISSEQFFDAIRREDIAAVERLLAESPQLLEARTPAGETALHVAVEHDDAQMVKLLLERGGDPSLKYGQSAHTALSWAVTVSAWESAAALVRAGVKPDLFCAAGIGDLAAVRSFFDERGQVRPDASQTGSSRFAPDGSRLPRPPTSPQEVISDALYIACRSGRANVVKFLLERGADVSFRAYLGGTALHWAYFGGSQEVIRMLQRAGADANALDDIFRCAPRAFGICVPANWGIVRLVRDRLAEDKSLANMAGGRGTPLHEAARGGNVTVFSMLLAAGANLSARDPEGNLPVDLARKNNHAAIVQLIQTLESTPGALVKRKPNTGQALLDAAFAGDEARVRTLLDSGGDPNTLGRTAHRYRPLHRAIEHKKTTAKHDGHERVVKLLLDRGADPRLRATHARLDALMLAASGEPRFVPLLLDSFRPLDMHHAAICLDRARVEELLRSNPKLATEPDAAGWAPLHACAASQMFTLSAQHQADQLAIAKLLIVNGAEPNATFPWEQKWPIPVLYFAAGQQDNPALTEVLLDAGADPCDGESIYHASDEGHDACLALFERRVPPKKLAKECTGSLSGQLHWGRTRGMNWLLAHGANPNAINKIYRETALHAAIKSGRSEAVIRTLLEHGADPQVKNASGETAIQLARKSRKSWLLKLLEEKTRSTRAKRRKNISSAQRAKKDQRARHG